MENKPNFRIKGLSRGYALTNEQILEIIDSETMGGEVEFDDKGIHINLNIISPESIGRIKQKVLNKIENQADLS